MARRNKSRLNPEPRAYTAPTAHYPNTISARGRMSGGKRNPKTGNLLAGGGRPGFSTERGGKASYKGRLISRSRMYKDIRIAFGMKPT